MVPEGDEGVGEGRGGGDPAASARAVPACSVPGFLLESRERCGGRAKLGQRRAGRGLLLHQPRGLLGDLGQVALERRKVLAGPQELRDPRPRRRLPTSSSRAGAAERVAADAAAEPATDEPSDAAGRRRERPDLVDRPALGVRRGGLAQTPKGGQRGDDAPLGRGGRGRGGGVVQKRSTRARERCSPPFAAAASSSSSVSSVASGRAADPLRRGCPKPAQPQRLRPRRSLGVRGRDPRHAKGPVVLRLGQKPGKVLGIAAAPGAPRRRWRSRASACLRPSTKSAERAYFCRMEVSGRGGTMAPRCVEERRARSHWKSRKRRMTAAPGAAASAREAGVVLRLRLRRLWRRRSASPVLCTRRRRKRPRRA